MVDRTEIVAVMQQWVGAKHYEEDEEDVEDEEEEKEKSE